MSKKPETVFREKVVKFLKALPKSHFFSIQQTTIRGTPDILACINGKFIALEIKSSVKSIISELQIYNIQLINMAGGVGMFVAPENFENTKWQLEKLAYDKN